MAEYIEREAARDKCCSFCRWEGTENCAECEHPIDDIPAADVVPVRHGRWVWDGGEDMHYYCSCCHHNAYGCTCEILDEKYNYCPNCGAKMDKDGDSE